MDIDEDPRAVEVTIRGPVAAAAQVRAWITARAGQAAHGLEDDPDTPGWTVARMIVVPPEG